METQVSTEQGTLGFVYGQGPTIHALNAMVSEIAPTDIPILVLGESGTGKDAYATLIHRLSRYSRSSLRKINCSGVEPGELLAQMNEALGRRSSAEAPGSIYLDNIQELELACQRVLLSHLPDVEGAGSKNTFCPRIISSTTKNLESEVEAGRFRRELFLRLSGACLRIPPLRERCEDVPLLIEFFSDKHSRILKRKASPLSSQVLETLQAYHWPGNIRELENLVRKIALFGDIQGTLNDLHPIKVLDSSPPATGKSASLKVASRAASRQAERELILQALERTRWNRKRAAQELQISYKSLLYKLKEIGSANGQREN